MTGKELKKIFEELRLNRRIVAEYKKCKPQTIQAWFNLNSVSSTILETICDAYHLQMDDLYKGTPYATVCENRDKQNAPLRDDAQAVPYFLYEKLMRERDNYRDHVRDLERQLCGVGKEKTDNGVIQKEAV